MPNGYPHITMMERYTLQVLLEADDQGSQPETHGVYIPAASEDLWLSRLGLTKDVAATKTIQELSEGNSFDVIAAIGYEDEDHLVSAKSSFFVWIKDFVYDPLDNPGERLCVQLLTVKGVDCAENLGLILVTVGLSHSINR